MPPSWPRRCGRSSRIWSVTRSGSLAVEDFGGDEVDLATVADSCATPPFLSARRIVVVRDVGRFSTDEVAPLLAYLEDPLPTTVLILVAGGGAVAPKLAAAVKAHGSRPCRPRWRRGTAATGSGHGSGPAPASDRRPGRGPHRGPPRRGRQPSGCAARGAGRRLRGGAPVWARRKSSPTSGRPDRWRRGPSRTPSTPAARPTP